MLNIINKLIRKKKSLDKISAPLVHQISKRDEVFLLKYEKLLIGELRFNENEWEFKYSEDFKKVKDKFNHIAGFSNLNKVYRNQELWPFFQSRIPGLKQPAVKEILEIEHIDSTNKFELLKRFGKESINNPYELEFV
ncbi:HipA N-terminal domain-containing protein [Sphingobacterium paramultivorum]|uniref:HipA N-terminal domain-containing protein n=1 Tax=Sphingobacterium paramultivorum TaxID=2886510 RepID=UPI00129C9BC8|nr:HipA N-terminal domain-containing protein [Sphingobacterium paramultivorum]